MADASLIAPSELAARVGELVRIPSVNPLQAGPRSGDDGERSIATWMAERCDALGATVRTEAVIDDRSNVYARFDGDTDSTLTIDVHLDTVGVEHMTDDPFDGRIEDGRVWGRGSVDTKATLAIALAALEELARDNRRPVPTVHLVGTVSEEMGGLLGAAAHRDDLLANGTTIDRLIVAEPTMCAPVHGHKGALGLEITVHGHAAHSSKPHLGANAISAAARIITAVDAEQERLAQGPATTAVGPGTVSVTTIDGGLARNIIPNCCDLYCGRRVAPGEDPDVLFAELSRMVEAAAAPLDVTITLANGFASRAFFQDADSELISTLADLATTEPEVATYGSNALRYGEIAEQVVVFGPGSIDQAHKAVEWVDIDQLAKAADVYRTLLRTPAGLTAP